jgi:hypothetical protein
MFSICVSYSWNRVPAGDEGRAFSRTRLLASTIQASFTYLSDPEKRTHALIATHLRVAINPYLSLAIFSAASLA